MQVALEPISDVQLLGGNNFEVAIRAMQKRLLACDRISPVVVGQVPAPSLTCSALPSIMTTSAQRPLGRVWSLVKLDPISSRFFGFIHGLVSPLEDDFFAGFIATIRGHTDTGSAAMLDHCVWHSLGFER